MSDQDQNQRGHEDLNVWILGSSIGSLASAVFLIRDAEIPAPQIHLFESRRTPEDGLPTTGDAFATNIPSTYFLKFLRSLVQSRQHSTT
ncbi:oleate hydratase [Penicillium chrysogenum]|uniref:Oleate hydratase n=1 Tax=Penicillium chrysogenum TaxID=5076 RepID=A0ABQ8WEC4_PENCH|nr:oleate hydratase [Penicillium chrysogenum]